MKFSIPLQQAAGMAVVAIKGVKIGGGFFQGPLAGFGNLATRPRGPFPFGECQGPRRSVQGSPALTAPQLLPGGIAGQFLGGGAGARTVDPDGVAANSRARDDAWSPAASPPDCRAYRPGPTPAGTGAAACRCSRF